MLANAIAVSQCPTQYDSPLRRLCVGLFRVSSMAQIELCLHVRRSSHHCHHEKYERHLAQMRSAAYVLREVPGRNDLDGPVDTPGLKVPEVGSRHA